MLFSVFGPHLPERAGMGSKEWDITIMLLFLQNMMLMYQVVFSRTKSSVCDATPWEE